MEHPPCWWIYQEKGGFSWAMLVSGRVSIHPSSTPPTGGWTLPRFGFSSIKSFPSCSGGPERQKQCDQQEFNTHRLFQNAKHATCFTGPHRSVGFFPLFIRLTEKNTGIYISLSKKHVLTWPQSAIICPFAQCMTSPSLPNTSWEGVWVVCFWGPVIPPHVWCLEAEGSVKGTLLAWKAWEYIFMHFSTGSCNSSKSLTYLGWSGLDVWMSLSPGLFASWGTIFWRWLGNSFIQGGPQTPVFSRCPITPLISGSNNPSETHLCSAI